MPLSDFYTYQIKESDSKQLIVDVSINPKHPVYDGHFPDKPITPGVILIEIIRAILSAHTGKQLMLSSAKELKFSAPVIPTENTMLRLKISFEEIKNSYKVACLYTAGETTFTKLKGIFSAS